MFFNLLKELSSNSLLPTTSNSGHQDHPSSQVGDGDKRILTLFTTPPPSSSSPHVELNYDIFFFNIKKI